MKKIVKKLPQSLINQIAAGEVIERPASIVKELVDNCIDAQSTHIRIKVINGGIDLIEISDDGIGVAKDDLPTIFEAHTTSKLSKIEDLSSIETMGFRGEALSTILSIAQVTIASKERDSDFAYLQQFEGDSPLESKKTAKEIGTTIRVENIFHNIPARKKFLKTPETEYRKILDILIPYFLVHPEIHFELYKGEKKTYDLPTTSEISQLDTSRISDVLRGDFTNDLIEIKSEGAGIQVSGYISHPRHNIDKGRNQYIFVNKRPIWDNGISRSIHQGYSRYIPHGQKVPFIINVSIDPRLVDVNIHPRKEEIKFENPFRVYSLIEDTVIKVLNDNINTEKTFTETTSTKYKAEYEPQASPKLFDGSREIKFGKSSADYSIKQGLEFSKNIIQSREENVSKNSEENETFDSDFTNVFQLFNKYIVIEQSNIALIIDQHAAAERINFERLSKSLETKSSNVQKLLVPEEIEINSTDHSFLLEKGELLINLGFEYSLNDNSISITAVPIEVSTSNITNVISEVLALEDAEDEIKNSVERFKSDLLATIACHSSIRAGQKLHREEMITIFRDLLKCDNKYSCPHGRPAIWKLSIEEIDSHFYRTY